MEAIRQIVNKTDLPNLEIPEGFGPKVEVIILPYHGDNIPTESWELMKIQEQSGFVKTVLADPQEDVWNDL